MNIQDLKQKSSEQLIDEAEKLGIENASTLKRQEIYFAILKNLLKKKKKSPEEEFFSFYRMDLDFLEQWSPIIYLEQMTYI